MKLTRLHGPLLELASASLGGAQRALKVLEVAKQYLTAAFKELPDEQSKGVVAQRLIQQILGSASELQSQGRSKGQEWRITQPGERSGLRQGRAVTTEARLSAQQAALMAVEAIFSLNLPVSETGKLLKDLIAHVKQLGKVSFGHGARREDLSKLLKHVRDMLLKGETKLTVHPDEAEPVVRAVWEKFRIQGLMTKTPKGTAIDFGLGLKFARGIQALAKRGQQLPNGKTKVDLRPLLKAMPPAQLQQMFRSKGQITLAVDTHLRKAGLDRKNVEFVY